MRETYSLPDGQVTHSSKKYVSTWRAMGNKVAELFDGQLYGYDPDFHIIIPTGGKMIVSVTVGKKLVDLVEESEKIKQENSDLRRRMGIIDNK